MGLSHDQEWTINTLVTATTVFSFLGSLFIISSLLFWTHGHRLGFPRNEKVNLSKEKIAFRLVFNVGVSDLFYEVSFWFTDPNTPSESHSCRFSGWLQQFGTLSSIMWVTCITYVIHTVVTNPARFESITSDMWKFHAVIWSTSFFTSFLPMTTSSYGQAGGWCWVDSEPAGIFWRFIIFYIPVWAIIGYICYIFYQSYKSLGLENRILKQMRLYPAILIVTWSFGTLNRIIQAAGEDVYGLVCLHAFLMSLYGFFNCCAYIYTPAVRESLLTACGFSAELNNTMVPMQDTVSREAEPAYDLAPVVPGKKELGGPKMSGSLDQDEDSSDIGPVNTSSFMDANVDIGVSESMNVIYAKASSDDFKSKAAASDGRAIEVQATYELDTGSP